MGGESSVAGGFVCDGAFHEGDKDDYSETCTLGVRGLCRLDVALVPASAMAQAKEQFFPGLPYRTGAYAPNGVPWANGYADYLKLVNARGGINGVKIIYEECDTGYDTARGRRML
jgi:hypothetical protein